MKTPTPWTIYDTVDPLKIGIKGFDRKHGGMHVATVIMPENADLIIRAVNNHDALVKALEGIAEFCSSDANTLGAIERLAHIRNTALNVLAHVGPSPDSGK